MKYGFSFLTPVLFVIGIMISQPTVQASPQAVVFNGTDQAVRSSLTSYFNGLSAFRIEMRLRNLNATGGRALAIDNTYGFFILVASDTPATFYSYEPEHTGATVTNGNMASGS